MSLADFTPHGFCLAWDPALIWLQALSDSLIAIAYFSIPAALTVFVNRRHDLAFRPVFTLFAAFIMACGTTHVLGVVTLWHPVYWLDGGVKAVTAAVSLATAAVLWPLLPQALALPSPASLRALNAQLEREIEQRDRTAARLSDSQTRLRQLYARSPAILHATDADGVIQDVSDRWLEAFGYERSQVIGRKILDFYAPATRQDAVLHLEAFNAGGGAPRAERQVLTATGEIRDVEVTYSLERDPLGAVSRVLAALTDVTARKQAEAALHDSEARLRQSQKMEAVGQLTGGIAHDFNNLLTAMMGSLELLDRQPGLDDRGRRLVATARESAGRGARLTAQLLAFSRRQRLAPEALDPSDVLRGIGELLIRTAGERITLTVEGAGESPWRLLADRNQLEMALLNLVLNARDAIAESGTITIAVRNREVGAAEADAVGSGAMAPGEFVSITVRDTGRGMQPEVRERALEPFFTTKPPGVGTGLGLSQTYGFVSQSGGGLRIETAPGKGTTVELLLPRATAEIELPVIEPKPAETSPPASGADKVTVLLVEDDALLRTTIADALSERGYTVIEARDGHEGIAILNATNVDVLFTDIMMPAGMSGISLARAARSVRPDLPVLFATGYSDNAVLREWTGPLSLLNKPYTVEGLVARLEAALQGKTHLHSVSG